VVAPSTDSITLGVADCVDAIALGFEVVTQSICEVLFVFDIKSHS
jgi:hypothetical protein